MLIGNYSVLNRSPIRWLGGTSAAHASGVGSAQAKTRSSWGMNGARRNFAYQDKSTAVKRLAGVPDGYGMRGWVPPQTAGALSAVNAILGSGILTATGRRGKNGSATLTGSASITATAQLVVSGSASLSGSGSVSASIQAARAAEATLSGSATMTGTVIAKGHISASLSGTSSISATRYATGSLSASITPFTDLSPQSLASQILDAEDIESSMTVRQALRLIAAATAGKVSGASGTTITIRSAVADSKERIVATVDGDGNRSAITYDLSD